MISVPNFFRSSLFICLLMTMFPPSVAAQEQGFRRGYVPLSPDIVSRQPHVTRYRAFLPVSIDLSKSFPTPRMQDAESCSAWAVGYAARSYYVLTRDRRDIAKPSNIPSPSFIYNAIRDPNNCKSGSLLLDAITLLKKGSLSVQQFPSSSGCRIPTRTERAQASDFRVKGWRAVNPKEVDDVKGQLALGHPVIFGMDVGPDFENLTADAIYRGERSDASPHAMTVVGYDDRKQAFKVINSWGTDWGDGGFGWIGYSAFRSRTREAYIIEVSEVDEATQDQVAIVSPEPEVIAPRPAPLVPVKPDVKPSVTDEINNNDEEVVRPIDRPVTDGDCSYVYSDPLSGKRRLVGFVGSEAALVELREQWSGQVQEFDVQVRPWPQCEVLLTLASAIDEKGSPRLSTKGMKERFIEGEEMVFELVTPPAPSFVYVTYVQADGSVLTLMQPGSELAPSKSGETVIFGDGKSGSPRFKAAPPLGTEMVLAVASASPLFDGPLPKLQTEREFLSALRRAVIYKSDQSKGDRRISAAFLGIQTEKAR